MNSSCHVKMDDPERPDKLLHFVTFASTSASGPHFPLVLQNLLHNHTKSLSRLSYKLTSN